MELYKAIRGNKVDLFDVTPLWAHKRRREHLKSLHKAECDWWDKIDAWEDNWYKEWHIAHCNKKIAKLERQIEFTHTNNQTQEQFDIEDIRNVPVENILPDPVIGGKSLCPFHEDKTPSLTVYKQTNSWYCWPCNEGGDVIKLYMKLHDVNFVTACRNLAKC